MNSTPKPETTKRSALIAGATGLVGRHLLQLLLDDSYYSKVYALTRRKMAVEHPKLEQIIVDFDTLAEKWSFVEVQDVYCCLGTTMKKAGSKAAFRKVDYTYPFELAKLLGINGASQFLLVSAMGANKGSLFFYNRVKGEVEEAISKVVQYRSIHIFRPSLLLGDRREDRKGEEIAQKLTQLLRPLMVGPFRKYRPIKAKDVAKGMLNAAKTESRGVELHPSEEIKKLARKKISA